MLGVINKDIQSIHKCTLSDHPLQAHSLGIESSLLYQLKEEICCTCDSSPLSRAVIYTWLWESCANDVVKLKEQRAKFLVLRLIALRMKYVMLEGILSMLHWHDSFASEND